MLLKRFSVKGAKFRLAKIQVNTLQVAIIKKTDPVVNPDLRKTPGKLLSLRVLNMKKPKKRA
jgi:hypothetical protein